MTSPLLHQCVSHSHSGKTVYSYLSFLQGLFDLMDSNRACDNIPEIERKKGILPVTVRTKTKHSVSERSHGKHLPFHWRQALQVPESLLWSPGNGQTWGALAAPLFPNGLEAVRFWTLHFQILWAMCLCLYSVKTSIMKWYKMT